MGNCNGRAHAIQQPNLHSHNPQATSGKPNQIPHMRHGHIAQQSNHSRRLHRKETHHHQHNRTNPNQHRRKPPKMCAVVVVLLQSHMLKKLLESVLFDRFFWVEVFKQMNCLLLSGRDIAVASAEEKKFRTEFNDQWKNLWRNLIGDKVHGEKIADRDYNLLFIEKGTVVGDPGKNKPLRYREILKQHKHAGTKYPPPQPETGGWGKFSQTMIKPQKKTQTKKVQPTERKPPKRFKKSGRGWLHLQT
jgi:hypothetical protein